MTKEMLVMPGLEKIVMPDSIRHPCLPGLRVKPAMTGIVIPGLTRDP
jgi:hypothetical protein